MEITIDTSAIISVITNEQSKEKIVYLSKGCDLIAPNSVHWEIGNALSAMIKRERANLSQAKKCLSAYGQIPIKYVEADLTQSIELVSSLKIYAYDAYLVRCALEFGTPLLTLDSGLKYAAGRVGVEVLEV
ncbi:MAG: type II toxin-antitoxin system VapC family toxin [Pseudomonadales bacterium]